MSRVSFDKIDLEFVFILLLFALVACVLVGGAFFGMDREDHRKRTIDHEIIAACQGTDNPAACVRTMKKALKD